MFAYAFVLMHFCESNNHLMKQIFKNHMVIKMRTSGKASFNNKVIQ